MSEFEYLDKQFRRLSEARSYMATRILKKGEKAMAENWKLSVEHSIKEYLEMRRTQEPTHAR